MKFEKVIGNFKPEVIKKAEENLSSVFSDLCLSYDNYSIGTCLGGDPLVFNLLFSVPHICTDTLGKGRKLKTAATDGKNYYWNPEFINKLCEGKSKIGLRIVSSHEAWHAIYMHPQRRGIRIPSLWNIAVDFKVNATILEDFRIRGSNRDVEKIFRDNLGDFITLEEYAQFLKDPFNPPARIAHLNPMRTLYMTPEELDQYDKQYPPMYFADANLPADMKRPENIYDYLYKLLPRCPECGKVGQYKYPKLTKEAAQRKKTYQDRLLKEDKKNLKEAINKTKEVINKTKEDIENESDKEKEKDLKDRLKELEDRLKKLEDALEDLEEEKAKNKKSKKNAKKSTQDQKHSCDSNSEADKEDKSSSPTSSGDKESDQSMPGAGNGFCGDDQGQPNAGSCGHGCGTCGSGGEEGYFDPLGAGETLDDHIDADISEEELGKRIADAVESAKKLAGKVPAGLEDELGALVAPKLRWEDFVRLTILKTKEGKGRNDWTRPKTRPMFSGLYIPKQKTKFVRMLVLLDTSGSMSADDMAYGISQLQVCGEGSEGVVCCFDTEAYWDKKTTLTKFSAETLKNIKVVGRGGTMINKALNEYKDPAKCGPVDLIVAITDSYLYDQELKDIGKIDVPLIWLITSDNKSFKPPIGRVFNLRNM